ncbi:MAG TPA: hypothetical protein K8V99_03605 [Megamonas funiformis]|uniref:hypothetical protein n=1 Tax=Enterococcus cecorum TaxID=44008 RepID=UPI00148B7349|nr:hypothetical protein [Enterococcus cecorum]HJG03659.1 hypothetical protein [Megamonas funiformis]
MKAVYKDGSIVDIWEISKSGLKPEWIVEAFHKNYLVWVDDKLRILLAGINPSTKQMIKLGSIGSLGGGGFLGYAMYSIGYIGDVIDITNRRVISKKRFLKEYKMLTNQG